MTVRELLSLLGDVPPSIEVRIQTEDENAHRIQGVAVCEPGEYIPYDDEPDEAPVAFVYGHWVLPIGTKAKGETK